MTVTSMDARVDIEGLVRRHSLEGCTALEDGGFAEMPTENLRELTLRWCEQLTGEVVAELPSFHRLERLDLGKCGWVLDEHLRTIARLLNLQALSLDGCRRVTDSGLAYLKGLERLVELDLRANPNVTVDGLLQLEGLRLRRLTVAACPRIGDGDLSALRARWPDCVIVR